MKSIRFITRTKTGEPYPEPSMYILDRELQPFVIRYLPDHAVTEVFCAGGEKVSYPYSIQYVMNEICIHYGSSITGRREAYNAKMNDSRRKLPILISEGTREVMFPIAGATSNWQYYIHYNRILRFRESAEKPPHCYITFNNAETLVIPCGRRIIARQMKRCERYLKTVPYVTEYKTIQDLHKVISNV